MYFDDVNRSIVIIVFEDVEFIIFGNKFGIVVICVDYFNVNIIKGM